MKNKPSCEECRELYKIKQKDPPCENCAPEVLSGNIDSVKIFNIVSNQVIVSQGVIIDIKHEPIHEAMNRYDIRNKRECFEGVIDLFHKYQKEISESGVIA